MSTASEVEVSKLKQTWYRKRQIVTYFGCVQLCVLYFEYSVVSITALYYYKETFKLENPNFYFGLSMAVLCASRVVSVFFCGPYMDRTRDLRKIVFVTTFFNTIGNLMYTMTYSKWLPIIGRFLCGISDGVRTSTSGKKKYSKK